MITLYKGINYNNSYNYIKLFSNEVEQGDFFNSLTSLIIEDKHGYIKTREYIDVKVNYDELVEEGYNYLEFTNNYKTIYAFITKKEYRNEKVTRLFYEIDVCQTYQFDFRFASDTCRWSRGCGTPAPAPSKAAHSAPSGR